MIHSSFSPGSTNILSYDSHFQLFPEPFSLCDPLITPIQLKIKFVFSISTYGFYLDHGHCHLSSHLDSYLILTSASVLLFVSVAMVLSVYFTESYVFTFHIVPRSRIPDCSSCFPLHFTKIIFVTSCFPISSVSHSINYHMTCRAIILNKNTNHVSRV